MYESVMLACQSATKENMDMRRFMEGWMASVEYKMSFEGNKMNVEKTEEWETYKTPSDCPSMITPPALSIFDFVITT